MAVMEGKRNGRSCSGLKNIGMAAKDRRGVDGTEEGWFERTGMAAVEWLGSRMVVHALGGTGTEKQQWMGPKRSGFERMRTNGSSGMACLG